MNDQGHEAPLPGNIETLEDLALALRQLRRRQRLASTTPPS